MPRTALSIEVEHTTLLQKIDQNYAKSKFLALVKKMVLPSKCCLRKNLRIMLTGQASMYARSFAHHCFPSDITLHITGMSEQVPLLASTSTGEGAESGSSLSPEDARKTQALEGYKKALKNHEDLSSNVKKCKSMESMCCALRMESYPSFYSVILLISKIRLERPGKELQQDGRRHQGIAICGSNYW